MEISTKQIALKKHHLQWRLFTIAAFVNPTQDLQVRLLP